MDTIDREQNLKRMEKFFKADLVIKRILNDISPKEENMYDQDKIIKYVDRLFSALEDIKFEFDSIIEDFQFPSETVEKKFVEYKNMLLNCRYEPESIKRIYQRVFWDMSSKLVESVKENCKGYFLQANMPLRDCETINEFLHVFHSYIINNEKHLQSMPKRAEKINNNDQPITLYGEDNPISKEIFDTFPQEFNCGEVDIVSLENKILMMIRDVGHALSIEIDEDKDERFYIRYFIPKICNVKKVNELRGINKVKSSEYIVGSATGVFDARREDIVKDILKFISRVPTDLDMYEQQENIETKDDTTVLTSDESLEDQHKFEKNELRDLAVNRNYSRVNNIYLRIKNHMKFIRKGKNGNTRDE